MSQRFEYFGKYILLEKIASGGMAEVFLARAPGAGGIGKFTALKRILPQFSDNPEYIGMFKSEAKIAVNLSHSNVVAINEFGIEKGCFYLVMEYVEGRNLRQILNKLKKDRGELSIEQVIYIIKEVAAGLDHAHRCLDGTTGKPLNIIHRDMSPQNIMVSFEGQIKIIDFGIAKAETQIETTKAGTLKGKYGYMSPEQAEGQIVDIRTDIFSLGIVLWEVLANERLFIANNEINTLRKIRDCQVPSLKKINPNVHPELERIAQKALARDRNLRYQYAAALHRDLNRFLNRQYPDFSPHDFAVTVKSLFAEDILGLRKRLVDYSKIPFPSVQGGGADDKTMITKGPRNQTKSNFFSKSLSNINEDTHLGKQQVPSANENTFTLSSTDSEPTDADDLDEESLQMNVTKNTSSVLDENAILKNLRDSTADPFDHKRSPGGSVVRDAPTEVHEAPKINRMHSHYNESTASSPAFKKRPQIRIKRTIRIALMPLVIAALTVFLYKNPSIGTKDFASTASNIFDILVGGPENQRPKESEANPSQPVRAATKTLNIVVNSKPSGAEIYVNGINTGKVTPSRVTIEKGAPFDLTLKKDLYIDYTKYNLTITSTDNRSLNATLQRAMVAYLDIDIRPPLPAHIYINGERLEGEQLPIVKYAVPARQNLVIRAVDPYTNRYDERTVQLAQDQRRSIILNLQGKRARRPAKGN